MDKNNNITSKRINKYSKFFGLCIAWLLALLLISSALIKLISWSDFFASIQSFSFFRFFNNFNHYLIPTFVITIEFFTGILLVFPKVRKLGTASSFILFNIFLLIMTVEIKTGNLQGNCPCFGTIFLLSPSYHGILIIICACASFWLFSYSEILKKGYKNFLINLCIYLSMVAIFARPMFSKIKPTTDIYTLINLVQKNCNFSNSEEQINFFVLINLADLNCANCMICMDQFLVRIYQNEIIKNKIQLLITHPDTSIGHIRAKGWKKANNVNIESCYVNYFKIEKTGIRKSGIILFKKRVNVIEYITFPHPINELMNKIKDNLILKEG
jgi:hypothetical protein